MAKANIFDFWNMLQDLIKKIKNPQKRASSNSDQPQYSENKIQSFLKSMNNVKDIQYSLYSVNQLQNIANNYPTYYNQIQSRSPIVQEKSQKFKINSSPPKPIPNGPYTLEHESLLYTSSLTHFFLYLMDFIDVLPEETKNSKIKVVQKLYKFANTPLKPAAKVALEWLNLASINKLQPKDEIGNGVKLMLLNQTKIDLLSDLPDFGLSIAEAAFKRKKKINNSKKYERLENISSFTRPVVTAALGQFGQRIPLFSFSSNVPVLSTIAKDNLTVEEIRARNPAFADRINKFEQFNNAATNTYVGAAALNFIGKHKKKIRLINRIIPDKTVVLGRRSILAAGSIMSVILAANYFKNKEKLPISANQ